ncbi:MAG: hypothetical protein KF823_15610 [Xanthomonadales bacterium]|nr:hypothetical protein [Xanthomonadales bacterium]
MLRVLKSLFAARAPATPPPTAILDHAAPSSVESGGRRLAFQTLIKHKDGLPHIAWNRVREWCDEFADPKEGGDAWLACERAWLLHLRDALGAGYRLFESQAALLLSRQDDRAVQLTLAFMARTSQRVRRLLGRTADASEWGRDILIAFDDPDTYYRYVMTFHQPGDDVPTSAGIFIDSGCSHFASIQSELSALEPTIAHEMTHAFLAHLPLPTWLNEGIAVNVEHLLAGGTPATSELREIEQQHRMFWTPANIQSFWSGQAYVGQDQAVQLAYDLGRLIVSTLGQDWTRFEDFVLAAHWEDAGDSAANEVLAVDLGDFVGALLGSDESDAWRPRPEHWTHAPQKDPH